MGVPFQRQHCIPLPRPFPSRFRPERSAGLPARGPDLCPTARLDLAEEKGLARGADYTLVECLALEGDAYRKDPLLLEANPKGMVPSHVTFFFAY